VVIYGYDNTGEQFKYLVNDPWNGRKAYTYKELMVSQMYRGSFLQRQLTVLQQECPTRLEWAQLELRKALKGQRCCTFHLVHISAASSGTRKGYTHSHGLYRWQTT